MALTKGITIARKLPCITIIITSITTSKIFRVPKHYAVNMRLYTEWIKASLFLRRGYLMGKQLCAPDISTPQETIFCDF
jgi:hypothetical protein